MVMLSTAPVTITKDNSQFNYSREGFVSELASHNKI